MLISNQYWKKERDSEATRKPPGVGQRGKVTADLTAGRACRQASSSSSTQDQAHLRLYRALDCRGHCNHGAAFEPVDTFNNQHNEGHSRADSSTR
jgi:hypothetical protein